jgi:uncharacterized protein (TIGR03437 family)
MKDIKKIISLFSILLLLSCSKDEDNKQIKADLLITSISPEIGPKNTAVTITGTGFSNTIANNTVTINGKVCAIVSTTTTQMNIIIPPSAGSGKIKIVVGDANAESNNFEFIVTTTVSTIAGSTQGNADGQGSSAQFNKPMGIAIDATGNLFITDTHNHRLRKISPTGLVSTFAGSSLGFANGTGEVAKFNFPTHITVNKAGQLFVTDLSNNKIRKITPIGLVDTFPFLVELGALPVTLNNPFGITSNTDGGVFVADSNNFKIRRLFSTGSFTVTIAGSVFGTANGQGILSQFANPKGIEIDASENLYVADDGVSKLIRKISSTGLVTTLAGGTAGFIDGQGTTAKFRELSDIAVDADGNLFVTDKNCVRKISPTGLVTTVAGSDTTGFADGEAATAQFNLIKGIAIDSQGNLYVADTNNHKIRKITFD